jgi:transcriptional regulator with XRE-family HTH domain
MRVRCRLRVLRGDRSLRAMEAVTGISRGYLSRYENGKEFPRDHHVEALERAYGEPWTRWYGPHVVVELVTDHGHPLGRRVA